MTAETDNCYEVMSQLQAMSYQFIDLASITVRLFLLWCHHYLQILKKMGVCSVVLRVLINFDEIYNKFSIL